MVFMRTETTRPMSLLSRLHAWTLRLTAARNLVVISRLLLAVAFVPTGLIKLLGEPFSNISTDNPIGYFFDAFHASGLFYRFVGLVQIIGGLLLLIPRVATLGAVIFFPIILNIFVLTVSLGFRGTPVVTGLMLLAATYLLWWDFDRLRFALPGSHPLPNRPPEPVVPQIGRVRFTFSYIVALVGMMFFFLGTRGLAPFGLRVLALIAALGLAASIIDGIRGTRSRSLLPDRAGET